MNCNNKGYTLIELMIVMAVIALLSGISIFALQGARASARDAQRKGDLEAIRSALELYKSDCNTYPDFIDGDFRSKVGGNRDLDGGDGGCSVGSSRVYLNDVPSDPTNGTNTYYYRRLASGYAYELCAKLEEEPTSPESCDGHGNYKVTNP